MKTILLIPIVLLLIAQFEVNAQQYIVQNTGLPYPNTITWSISAVNENVVWATTYPTDVSGPIPVKGVTRTTNGGNTWIAHAVTNYPDIFTNMISAVDSLTAWIAMEYMPPATNLYNQGIYKTSDGGITWTKQTTATFNNSDFVMAVHFWDADTGWALGTKYYTSGKLQMYTTTNGGNNWMEVPPNNIPDNLPWEDAMILRRLSVVNNTIWFCTYNTHYTPIGRVFKSTDRGLTWSVSPVQLYDPQSPISFKNDSSGLLACSIMSGSIWASHDGGIYWDKIFSKNMYFADLQYVPKTEKTYALSSGADYQFPTSLAFSFDDGYHWFLDSTFDGMGLGGLAFINDSVGWIGGLIGSSGAGGIYKVNGVVALPLADFSTNDTIIPTGGQSFFINKSKNRPLSYNWKFDGGIPNTSTDTNPGPITFSQTGWHNITLITKNYFGSDTLVKEGYIHVGDVGEQNFTNSSIVIYPNPAMDKLTLETSASYDGQLSIITLTGQQILSQKLSERKTIIDISALQNGIYFVRLTNDKTVEAWKFIKQ